MLISGLDLNDTPVLSLQTGTELARADQAIVNPHDLSIIAFNLSGATLDVTPSLLRIEDIRELSPIGMIVDSSDEFVQPEDIIKLNTVYKLEFEPIGKPVLDEKRNKIGKVIDFTIDSGSFVIQQLIVKRPLLKSFNDSELIVHRSQIVEITDEAIIVKSKAKVNQTLPKDSRNYVNPFRSSPQTEAFHTSKRSSKKHIAKGHHG